jgi:hypothetical protein
VNLRLSSTTWAKRSPDFGLDMSLFTVK